MKRFYSIALIFAVILSCFAFSSCKDQRRKKKKSKKIETVQKETTQPVEEEIIVENPELQGDASEGDYEGNQDSNNVEVTQEDSQSYDMSSTDSNTEGTSTESYSDTESYGDTGDYKYHIIVGSFNNEGNAIKFKEQLELQGNSSRVINSPTGHYRVSIKSFTADQKVEAFKELVIFQDSPNTSRAWIHIIR